MVVNVNKHTALDRIVIYFIRAKFKQTFFANFYVVIFHTFVVSSKVQNVDKWILRQSGYSYQVPVSSI